MSAVEYHVPVGHAVEPCESVMKQGSIIVTPTASAETTCSHGSPRASGSSIPSAVSTA
ncbi:hypothetical protein ACTFPS_04220 [Bifidobacterium longum subsp. infantis]|uniref:hypothetical protein n=1 Tax=Bifidobacterium longum TaxID=216816 RepID=UPI0019172523|nr:hypothetical protein [Bifidobacterium longum]